MFAQLRSKLQIGQQDNCMGQVRKRGGVVNDAACSDRQDVIAVWNEGDFTVDRCCPARLYWNPVASYRYKAGYDGMRDRMNHS